MHWLAIWRVDCSVVVCDVAFAPLLSFIELFLRQYVDSTHFVLNSFTWINTLLLDLEIEEISPSKTRWVAYLAIFVAKSERFLRRNMITSFFALILAVIQHFDHVVAEERVLELSLHNAICAEIVPDTVDVRLCSNLLNLAKFWLILANFGCICLTCMALLPSLASSCAETCRFLARMGRIKLLLELLLERDEEPSCRTVGDGLTVAFDAVST